MLNIDWKLVYHKLDVTNDSRVEETHYVFNDGPYEFRAEFSEGTHNSEEVENYCYSSLKVGNGGDGIVLGENETRETYEAIIRVFHSIVCPK